jgi:Bacterial extracellular solute-binding proteins, family 5 Middle
MLGIGRRADYVPRQEPASWLAGGKRIVADRIEWIIIDDQGTANAALQNGEVDWWERASPDLVPLLRKNRNVMVDIEDPLGSVSFFIMNHLYPPFNDLRARRAILMALSQEDYMRDFLDDDSLWKPLPGFFTPGTPLYNEEGGEILKGRRNFDAANLNFSNSISLWRRMKPATAVFSGNSIGSERCGLRFADCESGGVRLPAMRVLAGARRRSERQNGTWFSPGPAAQEELKVRRRYR